MKDDISVEEFLKKEKAYQIILLSLKEILPAAGNWFAFFISIIMAMVSSVLLGFEMNTVEHFKGIVEKCLDVELSILGCVLAVYSIMIAFFNKDFMRCLLQGTSGNKSVLKRYVSYYESILFLYFIGLCITGIYMLVLSFMPTDFVLTDNNVLNNILAGALIFIYVLYTVRIFYEVKSLIYNTIMLFRASIAEQFIEDNK